METKPSCPCCNSSTNVVKNGLIHTKKKQGYKCKLCNRQFVVEGQQWFVSEEERALIKRLLLERLSLRGICRCVGVSLRWLMSYIKEIYAELPDDLHFSFVKEERKEKGKVYIKLEEVESDEMWSFVGNKENKKWIWLALEKKANK